MTTDIANTVTKNIIFRALVEGTKLLGGVVLVVILARLLGPGEYGRLSFVLALMTFFSVGLNLGLPLTFIREGARRGEFLRENMSTGLAIQGCAYVVLLFLLAVGSRLIPSLRPDMGLVLLALTYSALTVIANYLYSFFQAVERMHLEAIAVMVQNLLTLLIVLLLLLAGHSAWAALWGYTVASLVSLVVTLLLIRKKLFTWSWEVNWSAARELVRKSWPLMASLAFGAIYHSLDTIMLRAYQGNEVVGVYSAQYRVVFAFYTFGGWYIYSIFPQLASTFHENKAQFRYLIERSLQNMSAVAFLFGLIITIFARPIIFSLYGSSYGGGVLTLQIMIWSVMILLVGTIFYHGLVASGRQDSIMRSVGFGTLVLIVSNSFLIPRLGMVGAAISTILAQGVQLGMNYRTMRAVSSIEFFSYILRPFVVTVATSILFGLLYPILGLSWSGLLAVAAYCLIVLKLEIFNLSEIRQMFRIIARKTIHARV